MRPQIEWTVGPVDVSDGNGHEVISRWTTGIASGGYVYTDSNGARGAAFDRIVSRGRDHLAGLRERCHTGREFQQHLKDFRPTWPLNDTEPVSSRRCLRLRIKVAHVSDIFGY